MLGLGMVESAQKDVKFGMTPVHLWLKISLNASRPSDAVFVDDSFGPTGNFINVDAPIPLKSGYEFDMGAVHNTCRKETCNPVKDYSARGEGPSTSPGNSIKLPPTIFGPFLPNDT